jgi:hypothetical protein
MWSTNVNMTEQAASCETAPRSDPLSVVLTGVRVRGRSDQHIRDRSCETLPPRQWYGIGEVQKQQLERRVSAKTKEENRYIIYEILFPGAPRPTGPCEYPFRRFHFQPLSANFEKMSMLHCPRNCWRSANLPRKKDQILSWS